MTLVHKQSRSAVAVGDRVADFRNNVYKVTGWSAPTHPASTGRVYVRPLGSMREDSFFPSVVDLEWEKATLVFDISTV